MPQQNPIKKQLTDQDHLEEAARLSIEDQKKLVQDPIKTELEELKEKLASIEHERWADWQSYCHTVIRGNLGANVPLEQVLARWDRQIMTPYASLSNIEKDSDREQVDRYFPLIEAFLKKADLMARKNELEGLLGDEYKIKTTRGLENWQLEQSVADRLSAINKELEEL